MQSDDEPALSAPAWHQTGERAEAPEDILAEQLDPSSQDMPDVVTTESPQKTRRTARRSRRAAAAVTASRSATRRRPRAVRNVVTLAAVAGMVATVAIPLLSVTRGEQAEAVTVQQVALKDAQALVVASAETPVALDRGSYAATTPEEIQKKKDEEAAQAALAARLASSSSTSTVVSSGSFAASIATSGEVVRPLVSYSNLGEPYAGHKGTDYMAPYGTPIYAIADGVVVTSSESGAGWGVYIKIAHNIGGQGVTSLYAHMAYGSRAVSAGETVTAGQYLGQVSDTGLAYGTHLHLEIYVNGSWVYPEDWLIANAR